MGIFDGLFNTVEDMFSAPPRQDPTAVRRNVRRKVVPITERIPATMPLEGSYYPHQILLLHYADKYDSGTASFPKFWWTECGMNDEQVRGVLYGLVQDGMIEESNIRTMLMKEKSEIFREIMTAYELPVQGFRNKMVDELLEKVPEQELMDLYYHRCYTLTEKGKELLDKYPWIPFIHIHPFTGMDIWTITEIVRESSETDYQLAVFSYLEQLSHRYRDQNMYAFYRDMLFEMARFLNFRKQYDLEFRCLAEGMVYELNGWGNGADWTLTGSYSRLLHPYQNSTMKISARSLRDFQKCTENLGLSRDAYELQIRLLMREMNLPFQTAFTPEETAHVISWELTHNQEMLKRVYRDAARNCREFRKF